jgi:hypothetical protein
MFCGLCESGISADEKFKYMKNGNVHRYVYYGCSKSKDSDQKGFAVDDISPREASDKIAAAEQTPSTSASIKNRSE